MQTSPRRSSRWIARLTSTIAAIAPLLVVTAGSPQPAGATGSAVTIVGDSLTVGTSQLESALTDAGWGDVFVSAKSGRHIYLSGDVSMSGMGSIRAIRASGRDTQDWVIALGTNDLGYFSSIAATETYLQQVVDEIGTGHRIAFVTLAIESGSAAANRFNTVVRSWASSDPSRFLVIDWDAALVGHANWFADDGIHYTSTGCRNREAVIVAELAGWLEGPAAIVDSTPVTVGATGTTIGITAVESERVVDTRIGLGLPRRVSGGSSTVVSLASSAPVDATGAIVNVTTAGSTSAGYLSASGCATVGATSVQNYSAAAPVASLATVPLGNDHEFCVLASSATDLVIDVVAWLTPGGGALVGTDGTRLYDSRATGVSTVHRLSLGEVPDDASGVLLNLTVPAATSTGHLTVAPCGSTVNGSSLNFAAGQTTSNLTLVPIDDGAICVTGPQAVDAIVDLVGWISSSAANTTIVEQTRVLDTRHAVGGWSGRLEAGQTVAVALDLPAGTGAALVEVVSTGSSGDGYLTIAPCSEFPPATSTVNTAAGADRSNLTLVEVGDDDLCVFTSERTHVVLDVQAVAVA